MGRFHRHSDGTPHRHDGLDGGHDGHGEHDGHDGHDSHGHGGHGHGAGSEVGDHSGYRTGPERVELLEGILSENDRTAAANRADFAANGVSVVNLMSSPGAGKTTLLRRTLATLGAGINVGVVEGDIETSLDADRLEGLGAEVTLVNTSAGFGGECHLDAVMVRSALAGLSLSALDLVVIENVGNLVCPAEFDVGEHARAMVFSVTEGEEKPLKYPVMFRSADLVVVNKVDLLPYLDFDLDLFLSNLADVNPGATVIRTSARTGEGLDGWCSWLRDLATGSGAVSSADGAR